jgi:hypothetical protein
VNEPDYCSRYSHPAWGVVDIVEIPGPLPLLESQEPLWYQALDEDAQEPLRDRWWQEVVSWLSSEGATVIMVQLTTLDLEMARAADFTRISKWKWQAEWNASTAEVLFQMNPDWAVVRSDARQLLSMFDTWDGVTTEQDLRAPYLAA